VHPPAEAGADPSPYGALLRLTTDWYERVLAGDDSGAEAFSRRREELLRLAGGAPREAEADTIRRILAADRQLLDLLERRRAEIHAELARLAEVRRSLASYGAAPPASPSYVERLG
jgi:hypothetical protein